MAETLWDLVFPTLSNPGNCHAKLIKYCDCDRGLYLSLSRSDLSELSERLAVELDRGGSRGAVCLLFDDNSSEFLAVFPALLAAVRSQRPFYTIRDRTNFLPEIRRLGATQVLAAGHLGGTKSSTPVSLAIQPTGTSLTVVVNQFDDLSIFKPINVANLAYAITTSGSTGQPKLVSVSNSSIVPNIRDFVREFGTQIGSEESLSTADIFLSSPLTFDPSLVELFLALSTGASLVVVPRAHKTHPDHLHSALFVRNSVSVLLATPSLLSRIFQKDLSDCLRIVAVGGERCSPSVLESLRALRSDRGVALYHMYGLTEMSVWQSLVKITPELDELCCGENIDGDCFGSWPIFVRGKNILTETELLCTDSEVIVSSSSRVCLIDSSVEQRKIEADGEENEKEGEWAGMKIENKTPYIIHTGDLAKWSSDGNILWWVGRLDNVVKVNGQKVSLDTLEAKLTSALAIPVVCVFCRGEILAFVAGLDISPSKLLAQAASKLNNSDLPNRIVVLPEFPVNNHGKVDRKQLVEHFLQKKEQDMKTSQRVEDEAVMSENNLDDGLEKLQDKVESVVTRFWYQFLTKKPSPQDNFIRCGGDSFTALTMVNLLSEVFPLADSRLLDTILMMDFNSVVKLLVAQGTVVTGEKRTWNKREIDHVKELFKISQDEKKRLRVSDLPSTQSLKKADSYTSPNSRIWFKSKGRASKNVFIDQNNKNLTHYESPNHPPYSYSSAWKVDFVKCIDSSPLLIYSPDDRIAVVGSHSGWIRSVRLASGETIWSNRLPDRIEASPVCDSSGKRIFIGCYDAALYCLSAETGQTLWSHRSGGVVKCSPLVVNDADVLYYGSYDHCLYKLGLTSGVQLWSVTHTDASLYASPIMISWGDNSKGVLTASLDGSVVCSDPVAGSIVWRLRLSHPVFATPLFQESTGQVFIAAVNNVLYGVTAISGEILWNFRTEAAIFSSPIPYANTSSVLFGCHDRHLYCVSHDGHLVWKTDMGAAVFASPDCDPAGLILCATVEGRVSLVEGDGGKVQHSLTVGGHVFSSPILLEEGILVGSRDNFLYFFRKEEMSS